MLPKTIERLCNKVFLKISSRLIKKFPILKSWILSSRLPVIVESYISFTLFVSLLSFILSLLIILLVFQIKSFYLLLVPTFIGLSSFLLMIFYPKIKALGLKKDIEDNLLFAALYLYVLSKANVPPSRMFEIIAKTNRFGGISREARYIIGQSKILGIDLATAIENTIKTTPSNNFKNFLYLFLQTIKSEGNLREFLYNYSNRLLIESKIKLRDLDNKLSLISTIYSTIFITLPILLVAISSIFVVILKSTAIFNTLFLGVVTIIPLINIVFLYFLKVLNG